MGLLNRHISYCIRSVYKAGLVSVFCFFVVAAHGQFNVNRLLTNGRIALHYEDYVLSIQYFNQAISQKPYLWEPWQLRAVAKFYLDDWSGAEADAAQALTLNPYVTSLYDLRGISRIRQEKYKEALEDYTRAVALDPDNKNFWYNRVACMAEQKEYDAANLLLDTMTTRWAKYAPVYLLRASVSLQTKDTLGAEKWIEKSLAIDSFNADAWRVRANIAMSKERFTDSDRYFSRALHLKPQDAGSLVNRAVVRQRLNNLRGAMSDYDEALLVQPNNFLAHYNRGLLRQQVGDDNRAIEDFDFVLTYEPDNYMALFNRATLLERTGDLKQAVADYTRVINKFPNFWTGLYSRARCYRKMGQTAKAELDEFKVLKAQMDKRQGHQQRWSASKVAQIRKESDIDPEKYDQLVVNDEEQNVGDYKSEYRGRVQNRQVATQLQPYIAMTLSPLQTEAVGSFVPFDVSAETFVTEVNRARLLEGVTRAPRLGYVAESGGAQTEAVAEQLTALEEKASDSKTRARLLLIRSVAHSSAQDYDGAIADLDMARAQQMEHADSVVLYWQMAVCGAMRLEHTATADMNELRFMRAAVDGNFDKALEVSPDNGNVLYCYGTFKARQGDYEEAERLLTKAIAADGKNPYAYYNRGIVRLHNDAVQKSREDFSKAGELGLYRAYSLLKKK